MSNRSSFPSRARQTWRRHSYLPRRDSSRRPVGITAVFLLALTLAAQPPSAYDEAARLYSAQQFDQAERVLREAVSRQPRSANLRFLLGATLLQLQRSDDAIRELREAARLDPRRRDAAKLLASELVGQKQYAEAIRYLTPLVAAQPGDEETYLLLTQAYYDRGEAGDNERAIDAADQGLKRYPRSAGLMTSKALALREVGRLAEAQKLLEQALRLHPGLIQAQAVMADVFNRQGNYAPAIPLFRAVLVADAGHVESRVGLSRALVATGATEEALAEMNRAKELAPDNARIRLELSQLYSKLGMTERAREEAEAFRQLRSAKR
jgi:predicted Zn-dependent protease